MTKPDVLLPDSITQMTACALSGAIHQKTVSCREVMQAYLKRIELINPQFNALVSILEPELCLAMADQADAQLARGQSLGWMHGMPQAIKDLSPVAGMVTSCGSPLLREFKPTEDAIMVERMKAAGALIIARTNVPEFGLGSHTFNSVFGATGNAYAPDLTAGGSSGGAAVALALNLLPVADGSDFMGSLRNPASWNHVYGLRPSQGLVPFWPRADAWVSQLATEGPMARNLPDLARLLQTQSGFDERVPLSFDSNVDYLQTLQTPFTNGSEPIRIGWLGNLGGYLPIEAGILPLCEAALAKAEANHHCVRTEQATINFDPAQVWQAWLVWRAWLVASRLSPWLINPDHASQLKPEAIWECDGAQGLSANQVLKASAQRTVFYDQMMALFEQYDCLALPACQVWPFPISDRWPAHIGEKKMDTYHRWMEVVIYATFAGLPAISIPAGFGSNSTGSHRNLPMGLQLIGKPRGDAQLLRIASLFQAA
jgi:amidase